MVLFFFYHSRSPSGEDVGFWGDGMLEKKVFFENKEMRGSTSSSGGG